MQSVPGNDGKFRPHVHICDDEEGFIHKIAGGAVLFNFLTLNNEGYIPLACAK
jgi:hypothetical protein